MSASLQEEKQEKKLVWQVKRIPTSDKVCQLAINGKIKWGGKFHIKIKNNELVIIK